MINTISVLNFGTLFGMPVIPAILAIVALVGLISLAAYAAYNYFFPKSNADKIITIKSFEDEDTRRIELENSVFRNLLSDGVSLTEIYRRFSEYEGGKRSQRCMDIMRRAGVAKAQRLEVLKENGVSNKTVKRYSKSGSFKKKVTFAPVPVVAESLVDSMRTAPVAPVSLATVRRSSYASVAATSNE